jgi:hypothetical protein
MGARYSRTSGYTISRRTAPTRSTVRTVQRKVKLGPAAAKVIGIGVLAVLAIFMLISSNKSTTNLYDNTTTQKAVSETNRETENLKLQAKRAQSLEAAQSSTVKDQMVPADNVQFIEKGDVAGASTDRPTP